MTTIMRLPLKAVTHKSHGGADRSGLVSLVKTAGTVFTTVWSGRSVRTARVSRPLLASFSSGLLLLRPT